MCDGRGEAGAIDHALSSVVAEQGSSNDYTDDAMKESVILPVKKEASKNMSQSITSKVLPPVSDTVAAKSPYLSDFDSDIDGDSMGRIDSSLQANKDDDK
ncbi:hypothetical protein BGX33_004293, partial [Mortierella sp. NVP41]